MRQREHVVDELLVLGTQAGHTEAFEQLARRWHPRLLRHALRLTGDPDGAHEAVQETWAVVARSIRRLEDPACFGPWALRIAGRRCADWIGQRQRSRKRTATLEAARNTAVPPQPHGDRLRLLRELIARLDPQRQALLALFYVEGLTVAEIATVFDVPVGTVKSRLYHARRMLRANLEVEDDTHKRCRPADP